MKSLIYTAALLPLGALAGWGGKAYEKDEIVVVTSTRTVTVCPITEYFTCPTEDPTPTWGDWTSTSPTVKPATTTSSGSGGDDGGHGGGGHGGHGSSTSSPVGPATTSTSSHGGDDGGHGGGGHGTGTWSSTSTSSTPVDDSTTSSTSWSHPVYTSTSTPVGPDSSSSYTGSSSYSHPNGPDTTSSSPVAPTLPTYTTSSSPSTSAGPYTSSSSSPSGTSSSPSVSGTTSVAGTTTTSRSTTTSTTSCIPSQTVVTLPESICEDNTASDRSKWCGKSVTDDTHEEFKTGKTKYVTLTITSGESNFDGTSRPAFLINGGTPGPLIEANWGDMIEVTVTNLLTDNATTIHWHGIRQIGTNDQDGVPGVTECAIPPLGQRVYKFLASTYGTGWYHSHALSQYGGGIRGPMVIHGPSTANYDYDMGTIMVDEVFSQTIFQMAYNIARLRGPLPAPVNYLLNGKNKAIDGTKGKSSEWTVYPGKKHLFRLINSSAQASYVMHFDNHVMTVISADYTPIKPYTTDALFFHPGQRYNVIVTMNQTPGAYFLRAITQTGCGTTNLNTGLGAIANGIFTYKGSCGTPVTDTRTPQIGGPLQGDCKDELLTNLVPIVAKDGGNSEKFTATAGLIPGGNALQQVFGQFGPITRWFFGPVKSLADNNATVIGANAIKVDFSNPTLKNMAVLPSVSFNSSIYNNAVVLDGPAGDWVYFVIQNNFQTSHPIHLHGHDFSVLGQGKGVFTAGMVGSLNFVNPIRRDTALLVGLAGPGGVLASSGWTVIGFQTDNPGAWVMHCHIIWHADGGMALQYIEQPSAFDAGDYYGTSSFQNECSAYDTYVAAGGESPAIYESGLKRDLQRHQFGEKRFGHHGMH